MDKNLDSIKTSFNYRSTQYQPTNAYWLGNCASYAYESASDIKSKALGEWSFDNFHFIKRADTQCFIASTDKMVVLAFRGTEIDKYRDILSDADAALTHGYGGKVHKGFKQAYGKVRRVVGEKIKAHNADKKTLWVTGHSLGGAIALLAAYDLKDQGYKVNGVYTMGQPRVGDHAFTQAFRKRLESKCFRFIDKDDKVPEVPLKEFGYSDVGFSIYIASKGRLALHYRRSKNFLNDVISMGKALSAHSSDKYVKAIRKNIDNNPFTSDVQTIKEKDVINVNKEADEAEKAVIKEAKQVGKQVDKEVKKLGKKIKKIF